MHKGDKKYDPLFPLDYGLTYEKKYAAISRRTIY